MYRDLGDVSFGEVCAGTEVPVARQPQHLLQATATSARSTFGLRQLERARGRQQAAAGAGPHGGRGIRQVRRPAPTSPSARPAPPVGTEQVYRFSDVAVDNDRWSAFLDASFTILVGSLVAEVGWMQGSDPIEGFPRTSDFDPGRGHLVRQPGRAAVALSRTEPRRSAAGERGVDRRGSRPRRGQRGAELTERRDDEEDVGARGRRGALCRPRGGAGRHRDRLRRPEVPAVAAERVRGWWRRRWTPRSRSWAS